MAKRRALGVALGSGSARGWAHVGVLRALAEENVAPDLVAGCSMGAMIGAIFAAGRIEQLEPFALAFLPAIRAALAAYDSGTCTEDQVESVPASKS